MIELFALTYFPLRRRNGPYIWPLTRSRLPLSPIDFFVFRLNLPAKFHLLGFQPHIAPVDSELWPADRTVTRQQYKQLLELQDEIIWDDGRCQVIPIETR